MISVDLNVYRTVVISLPFFYSLVLPMKSFFFSFFLSDRRYEYFFSIMKLIEVIFDVQFESFFLFIS